MEALVAGAQKFGVGRLAALGLVGAGIVAALAAVLINISAQPMQFLIGNLDPKDASAMTTALAQAGTKYDVSPDGTTLLVPRDKVNTSRMLLASKNLLNSNSAGYTLLDNQSPLGQTDAMQQITLVRALDGELENAIRSMSGVTYVKVLLNIPQHQLFETAAGKPSAGVVIGMGARRATSEMVQAVQAMVAAAVPDMTPDMVAVDDQKGGVLASANQGELSAALADNKKSQIEADMRASLTDLVEKVVGPGNARVVVSADLDMTSTSETANVYDPDKQVVLAESTGDETSKDSSNAASTPVSAASNTPAGAGGAGADVQGNSTANTNSTTNYQNSNTVTTKVTTPGAIKRLSVSVVINEAPGAVNPTTGVAAPTPLSQQIQAAVSAAMGYDQARGDQLKVTSIAFKSDATPVDPKAKGPGILAGFGKNDIMRLVELVVLAVVSFLILLLGVKPLLKGLLSGEGALAPMALLSGRGAASGASGGGAHQIPAGSHGDTLAIAGPDPEGRIDMARIEGQVRASSVKQVAEFVEKHPDESVSILRSWLHESA